MLNKALFNQLPQDINSSLYFFPDFLPFNKDETQYKQFFQELNKGKKGNYLFTNGIEVKRVGFFRYTFESFKGWLGLTNHCAPACVQLSLKKLSYFGYVHGFNNSDLFCLNNIDASYQIPEEWAQSVSRSRTDKRSEMLQQELIQYYYMNQDFFPTFKSKKRSDSSFDPKNNTQYYFGQSYIHFNLYSFAEDIDPQHSFFLQALLKRALFLLYSPIKDSKFYKQYLQALLKPAQELLVSGVGILKSLKNWVNQNDPKDKENKAIKAANRALMLNPGLDMEHLELYMNCYIKQNNFEAAARLLHKIPLNDKKQLKTGLNFLKEYFIPGHLHLIDRKKPIGRMYARSLVEAASKCYLNSNCNKLLQDALDFDEGVDKLQAPLYFNFYIDTKNWLKAYEMYELNKRKHHEMASENLNTLAKSLLELARKEINQKAKNERVEAHFKKGYRYLNWAYQINPNDDYSHKMNIVRRLYAQFLIRKADFDTSSKEWKKAYSLLKKAISNKKKEDRRLSVVFAKVTMQKVYDLKKECCIAKEGEDNAASKLTKSKSNHIAKDILSYLNDFIKGIENKTLSFTKSLIRDLADAYYQRAELKMYFELGNKQDFMSDYKKAFVYAKDNAIYALSCYTHTEKRMYQDKGAELLKKMGIDAIDYFHWSKERWMPVEEKSQSKELGRARDFYPHNDLAPSSTGTILGIKLF